MFFPDLDGNGRADMLGVTGTWTNTAYAWLSPSCGLTDTEGDDEGGVVDPKLPAMPEEGEQDPDENDWKSITCTHPSVEDHTINVAQRWRDIDADGAWISVIEGWQKNLTLGRPMEDFSNNVSLTKYYCTLGNELKLTFQVSNFFHGPQDMYCENFAEDGNRCSGLALECHDVNYPAGVFILNSMSNVFAVSTTPSCTYHTAANARFALEYLQHVEGYRSCCGQQ